MHHIVLWKTWLEGRIETQWPFVLVDHTDEWRPRTPGAGLVSKDVVESIWASMDPEKILEFETQHIPALVLSALFESDSVDHAIESVRGSFPDAEILNCLPVLPEMLDTVRAAFMKEEVRTGHTSSTNASI